MTDLLSLDDALAVIGRVVRPLTVAEPAPLTLALNRVTMHAVVAPYALPPFTNTGVDGYAFRHNGQAVFKLRGASFAGEPFTGTLGEGEAARIATGAVLPDGADTVAMQEVCNVEGGTLTLRDMPKPGANIRHAGADIAQGSEALPKGRRLRPQDIALLGALGFMDVSVLRPLRVAIASTGHELLGHGDPLQPGRIIDTNSLMLCQMLAGQGVDVTVIDPLPDDYDATAAALHSAADKHDLIITTGGVSVGDRDYVRDVLRDAGRLHFWKLAIRPGKPVMLGEIGGCTMVGLPGNPVSAFVTFFLIVRPLLDALNGIAPALQPGFAVPLAAPIAKPAHLRAFSRARLEPSGMVTPYADQSSNLFTSLTHADGLLDLPAGREAFEAGEMVIYRPFTGLL